MKKYYSSSWKIVISVLFVFGLGATFYIFSNELKENFNVSKAVNGLNQEEAVQKNIQESSVQKSILDSLNTLKLAYDVVILEKSALSEELEIEKKNVENLMAIINASKNPSFLQLQVYRKQLSDLKVSFEAKRAEIKKLKSQNKYLLTEIESKNTAMSQQKIKNDTLVSHQQELESTLKTASTLDLSNFNVIALRNKNSGEELETNRAKNTNKLKASFYISGNSVAKTGKRVFYVQVLDQQNTVLGANKLIEFGNNKALVYSFIVAIDFQGKPVNVYGVLNSEGYEFKKGTYFVNFFDKQELVGSSSIVLK
ncbi:MAG: hypothetical protein ABI793_07480 [Flavobacterium sp.]